MQLLNPANHLPGCLGRSCNTLVACATGLSTIKILTPDLRIPRLDDQGQELPRRRNLYVTNPNLGASVSRDRLIHLRKAGRSRWRRKDAGIPQQASEIEIGLNLRSDRWAGADHWEAATLPGLTLDTLLDRCDVIDVGIDGGGLDDLLGLALLGRDRVSGRKLHWGHAWAHPSVLERRKGEAARFKDFAAAGDLTLVQQIGDDVTAVSRSSGVSTMPVCWTRSALTPTASAQYLKHLLRRDTGG